MGIGQWNMGMGLLGVISLAQIWFMPGYLFLYKSRGIHPLDKALLSIPLSAVLNFFLVYILVIIDAYTQLTMIFIFLAELTALLSFKMISSAHTKYVDQILENKFVFKTNFTNFVYGFLSLICFNQFINQIGTVFTQGDAVMSWNHWAISWFNGEIPNGLAWYPQLLPTLYSLTYQLIGDGSIELFSKISISLYPLVALAIFARISFLLPLQRNMILWSGIIFFLLVRRLWGSESNLNGYADFPLSFFCIAIVYVFVLKVTEKQTSFSYSPYTLPSIMIAVSVGAGLTKQSGVYLGILTPVAWYLYCRYKSTPSDHIKHSLYIFLGIFTGCASWYLYQYWRIFIGIEQSNLRNLSNIIPLPWYESIVYGIKNLTIKLSWLWVAFFLASLLHRKARYLSIFVVMPFFLLWAAFVPYDYRNLAVVFPLFAISLSYGSRELYYILIKTLPARIVDPMYIHKIVFTIVIAIFAITLANPKFNKELFQISNTAKKQIGDPDINNLLLAYFEFNSSPSLLATPYVEMSKIPGISERYIHFSCRIPPVESDNLTGLDAVLSQLNNTDIHYVFLLPWCDARVHDYFSAQTEKYTVIFRRNGAVLYKIRMGLEGQVN